MLYESNMLLEKKTAFSHFLFKLMNYLGKVPKFSFEEGGGHIWQQTKSMPCFKRTTFHLKKSININSD